MNLPSSPFKRQKNYICNIYIYIANYTQEKCTVEHEQNADLIFVIMGQNSRLSCTALNRDILQTGTWPLYYLSVMKIVFRVTD